MLLAGLVGESVPGVHPEILARTGGRKNLLDFCNVGLYIRDMKNDVAEAIRTSATKGENFAFFPSTQKEFNRLTRALGRRADESFDISGEGFRGPEARGYVDFFGESPDGVWGVSVIRP
jgi:hypothetical protein